MISPSPNPRSSHKNHHAPQCIICYAELDNQSSKDSRQMYKLCGKYLHSGMAKEIVEDFELEGSFSDKDQIPLCGKCMESAKELQELTRSLASLRKRVSDVVLIFSLEILHRRGKNARNEEAAIKLIQLDISKLPDNDSWSSPTFTTTDEIVSTEILESIDDVGCTDKEDNVDSVAYDLDIKDVVEIELLTEAEAEEVPGSSGGPLRETPCSTAESILPQENVACATEIGNTLEVSEYDPNEGIIRTTTGGKDQNAPTETNASEIVVDDVVIEENIDLTGCKDGQPKSITERNEKNMQNMILIPTVRLQKLRFQWKTNDNGENFIIVNDGVRSAKLNHLPKSEHILKKESQLSNSQTPEDLDIVQGLPAPSMLPNQMECSSSTVCSSSAVKQRKSERLKKTSVQKSSITKFKSKQSGDSAKGSLEKNGFPCDVCKKIFPQKSYLLIHDRRQHQKRRSYKCLLCSQTFSAKNLLKTHQRLKHGNKSVKCPVCDKEFAYGYILNTHIRTHTGEKPFKCSFCDKEFAYSNNLNTHARTHTGEKPFNCTFCERDFSYSNNLNTHVRTHTGEKPFNCTFCKMSFSRSSDLNRHIRTHTGEKPFNCTSCKMPFARSSDLKKHFRIHTGEKPFKCDKCDYSGAQISNLISHKIYRHSNKRSLKCRDCQKSFKTRGEIRRHYKNLHANIEFTNECILPNN